MNAKKNITVGPFDVMSKIFSQSGFRSMSLPEKIEQYFHDYSLIPLMIQVIIGTLIIRKII
jgi:replication factor C subunit 1